MKANVSGYRLNDYNASYEARNFIFEELIEENGTRTIKVIDDESGTTFWFRAPSDEYYKTVETPRRKPKRS